MQIRNTIIALVLLVIIGGVAYLVSQRTTTELTTKLFQIKPEDITQVDLKYPDRELEIKRDAHDKWQIVKPIVADADQTVANNLARAIADCEVKKTVEEKAADLKPFGLDKPQVIVTVTTRKKGKLPAIEIGKTTPVGFSAYIKTADKPAVMLTSSAFPPGMEKKVDDLRDRELMAFKVDDVRKLVIERSGGQTIEVDRSGDKWNIVKPAKYAADPTNVRQVLSALANARVADFISDAPSSVTQYGLEQPRLTVAVYAGKENARQSLLFGYKQSEQGKDGIYVRRGERTPVYTVHPYVMSDVDKSVFELRDKTVLGIAPAKVQRFTIATLNAKFTVERASPSKWQVSDGKKGDADTPVVERFLNTLHFLKGSAIVEDPMTDPKQFGMDKPTEEITLIAKDGKPLGWIKLAKLAEAPVKGGTPPSPRSYEYYVTSSAGTAVYAIDDYTFDQLNKTADEFRARTKAGSTAASKRALIK
jgi:Domain of unknown function (DUF4340)